MSALLLAGGAALVASIAWLLRMAVSNTKPSSDTGDGDVESVATLTDQVLAVGGATSIDDDHQPWDLAKFEEHS